MTTRTQIRQLTTQLGGQFLQVLLEEKIWALSIFLFFCIYAWFGSLGSEEFSLFCTMIGIWSFVDIQEFSPGLDFQKEIS